MLNRYRIMNAKGQVLCHKDTAQQAGDVVCNLGRELCSTQYIEDLRADTAFPFTVYRWDGWAFAGSMHGTREGAIAALKGPN